MQVPPLTLAFLAFHWGDAYLLSAVRERWVALRRDGRYFLVAGTLAELEPLIEADYRANPVSREYDPTGKPGLAAINATFDGDEREEPKDDGLDADTLITLVELRRAFPLWKIVHSAQTRTWTGRSRKRTIRHSSAVSLCIALTLIERRERQLAHRLGADGSPGPG